MNCGLYLKNTNGYVRIMLDTFIVFWSIIVPFYGACYQYGFGMVSWWYSISKTGDHIWHYIPYIIQTSLAMLFFVVLQVDFIHTHKRYFYWGYHGLFMSLAIPLNHQCGFSEIRYFWCCKYLLSRDVYVQLTSFKIIGWNMLTSYSLLSN